MSDLSTCPFTLVPSRRLLAETIACGQILPGTPAKPLKLPSGCSLDTLQRRLQQQRHSLKLLAHTSSGRAASSRRLKSP